MAPYVDTGILVKSNVSERNSHEADVLLFGTLPPLPLTHFQELEIRNAMRLKRGRGELSQLELEQSLRDFQEDIDAGRFERPIYDVHAVFWRAENLSARYTAETKARSLISSMSRPHLK
ncbi:MAG TPA: hypothetical protein VIT91_04470 [Chthoniobacterales bacterium]